MIDVIQNIPTEKGQLSLTAIKCGDSFCLHNNKSLCACVLPDLRLTDRPPVSIGNSLIPPINIDRIYCKSFVLKQDHPNHQCAIPKEEPKMPNTKGYEGRFCNFDSDNPNERHCKVLNCIHIDRRYRTCDIVPRLEQRGTNTSDVGTCYSYERKKPEELKMSNVKITYKPVDKKQVVLELIRRIQHPQTFAENSTNAPEWAERINNIYNDEDASDEIKDVSIESGDLTLRVRSGGLCSPGHMYIDCENHRLNLGHAMPISKQEARELGQALIKMSKQL